MAGERYLLFNIYGQTRPSKNSHLPPLYRLIPPFKSKATCCSGVTHLSTRSTFSYLCFLSEGHSAHVQGAFCKATFSTWKYSNPPMTWDLKACSLIDLQLVWLIFAKRFGNVAILAMHEDFKNPRKGTSCFELGIEECWIRFVFKYRKNNHQMDNLQNI